MYRVETTHFFCENCEGKTEVTLHNTPQRYDGELRWIINQSPTWAPQGWVLTIRGNHVTAVHEDCEAHVDD